MATCSLNDSIGQLGASILTMHHSNFGPKAKEQSGRMGRKSRCVINSRRTLTFWKPKSSVRLLASNPVRAPHSTPTGTSQESGNTYQLLLALPSGLLVSHYKFLAVDTNSLLKVGISGFSNEEKQHWFLWMLTKGKLVAAPHEYPFPQSDH